MTNLTDYGTDITIQPDLNFAYISGLKNLAYALSRRLLTPRGGLFYDPNYGTDLRQFINRHFDGQNLAINYEMEQLAINECEKDPRVRRAFSSVRTSTLPERRAWLEIYIQSSTGPFTLVAKLADLDREEITFDITNT